MYMDKADILELCCVARACMQLYWEISKSRKREREREGGGGGGMGEEAGRDGVGLGGRERKREVTRD